MAYFAWQEKWILFNFGLFHFWTKSVFNFRFLLFIAAFLEWNINTAPRVWSCVPTERHNRMYMWVPKESAVFVTTAGMHMMLCNLTFSRDANIVYTCVSCFTSPWCMTSALWPSVVVISACNPIWLLHHHHNHPQSFMTILRPVEILFSSSVLWQIG